MKKLSFIVASVILLTLFGCASENTSLLSPSTSTNETGTTLPDDTGGTINEQPLASDLGVYGENPEVSKEIVAESQDIKPILNKDYASLEIKDEGGFDVSGNAFYYNLRGVIILLEEKDIPIIEMKGSSMPSMSGGGNVHFDDTNWNFDFAEVQFLEYDVLALEKVVANQDLEAVYIETPFEIFTFTKAMGSAIFYSDLQLFIVNIIRIAHPQFATEKGIKLGDNPEQIESVYELVFDSRSYKEPDEDWSLSGDIEAGFITFVGNDSGVKYIEVGCRYTCSS